MTGADKSDIETLDDELLSWASDWCVRMADDGLSSEEEAEFRSWCEAEPRHQSAFDQVSRAWRAAGQAASSPAMLGLRRAALDDLHRARAFRWRRRLDLGWTAAAVGVAACIVGAVVFLNLQPRAYQTGLAERRIVALADGSKVSMDGATVVRVLYAGGRRQFWLDRGRAKFEVAKDPLRPFTVTAGHEMIVATGTQFSVELLRGQVRVALYEGHVTVWRTGEKGSPLQPIMAGSKTADAVLLPGRELLAPTNAGSGRVVDTDPTQSLSWEGGQLIFENEPLASTVERINRYTDHPLSVTEAAGRDIRISGVFKAGDTNAFIEGVVSLFPLRAVRSGDSVTLEIDSTRIAAKPKDAVPLG
jgi:transmembrane sensor